MQPSKLNSKKWQDSPKADIHEPYTIFDIIRREERGHKEGKNKSVKF